MDDEDSDTRSSFPSPFKQEPVSKGTGEALEKDTLSFRRCLNVESSSFFHHDGKLSGSTIIRLAKVFV